MNITCDNAGSNTTLYQILTLHGVAREVGPASKKNIVYSATCSQTLSLRPDLTVAIYYEAMHNDGPASKIREAFAPNSAVNPHVIVNSDMG